MKLTDHLKHIVEVERQRGVLLLPILLGIGIAIYFGLQTEPNTNLGIKLVLAACGITLVFRKFAFTHLTLAASIIALGFLSAQTHTNSIKSPLIHEPIFAANIKGRIHKVVFDEGAYKLVLTEVTTDRLKPEETPYSVRISIKEKITKEIPEIGSIIKVKATLFPLPEPVAPGAFDFGRYLFFENLGAVGFALSAPDIISRENRRFTERIHQFRENFAAQLISLMPNGTGAIAAALTVGEQGGVSEADSENLRASGLYHILSISGLHLALAAGIVFYFVRLILVLIPGMALKFPIKKIAAVFALISAFFYLLAAGWPVPAQRSFIMVAVVLVAILLDRKGLSLTTLAWAASFILLIKPDSLMGASFQLSFAATAAIVALYEHFGHVFYKADRSFFKKITAAVFGTMMVSLAATFATAPFVITHFNQLQLLGVGANALVTPIASFLIMPAVILSFILEPFGALFIAVYPLDLGIKWMMEIAGFVSATPYASVYLPSYTNFGFGLSIIGFLLLVALKTRLALFGIVLMFAGATSITFNKTPDVLISADAKQIAVHDEANNLVMVKGGAESFVVKQWMKKLGKEKVYMPKDARFGDRISLTCTESDCVYTCTGGNVLFVKKAKKTSELCTKGHAVAVLPFNLRKGECADVKNIIDKNAMKLLGAHAVYCADKIAIKSAYEFRGERPWVP